MIPKTPFVRIVRDILQPPGQTHHKIRSNALDIIQSVAEFTIATLFHDSYLLALNSNRKTLMVQDFKLAQYFRSDCLNLGLEEIGKNYKDLYYPEDDESNHEGEDDEISYDSEYEEDEEYNIKKDKKIALF